MAYWSGANLVSKSQELQIILINICINLRAEHYGDAALFNFGDVFSDGREAEVGARVVVGLPIAFDKV